MAPNSREILDNQRARRTSNSSADRTMCLIRVQKGLECWCVIRIAARFIFAAAIGLSVAACDFTKSVHSEL